MYRPTLLAFGFAVLACFALIWGAELVFPKSAASAIALVTVIVVGIWIVRPGWNLRPARFGGYWLALFGLLLASAAAAAWFLELLQAPQPYDFSTLNIIAALPGAFVLSGIEELLFRQVMYRWLEQRQVSGRSAVVATALAYALGHLGPIFMRVRCGCRSRGGRCCSRWPARSPRLGRATSIGEALIACAFRTRRPDETHRARLRVEIGRVRSIGRARARRWLAPPLAGFTTILLLPA
jgi:hypothetical protein